MKDPKSGIKHYIFLSALLFYILKRSYFRKILIPKSPKKLQEWLRL
ncbi:hypothetical protein C723_3521 [Christiangramia flava JLT2011]|nr:hypothetical protein C723_3521 [Christiangramia flava JLT2011]